MDAKTQEMLWSQRIEQLILAGWHDPSIVIESVGERVRDDEPSESDFQQLMERIDNIGIDTEADASLQVPCRQTDFGEPIYLLHFSRAKRVLHQALLKGRHLEQISASLGTGQSCKLPSGALLFVHAAQYFAIRNFVERLKQSLKPHHVVIAQAFLLLLQDDLELLSCKSGVKQYTVEHFATVSDDGDVIAIAGNCSLEPVRLPARSFVSSPARL
jgi:hypothetical protein